MHPRFNELIEGFLKDGLARDPLRRAMRERSPNYLRYAR
jgi:hypothetical protein